MPGRTNSTNNFSVTPYIVGQSLGAHCNYTVIQQAIDDSFNSGDLNPVWVQPGTYTENLTMRASVDVLSAGADGRLQNDVFINGNHTFTGSGQAAFSGISFISNGADLFTQSATVPGQQLLLVCKFSSISVTTGHVAVATAAPGTGGCVTAFFECQGGSDQSCLELGAACIGVTILSTLQSSDIVFNANGAGAFVQSSYSQLNGTNACVSVNDPAAGAQLIYDVLTSNGPTINYNAAGSVFGNNNVHNSSSGSTFYVDGLSGNYTYTNDTILGSAVDINPAITIANGQWRPRATAAASAVAAFAGTASFDSAFFNVTDGFVTLTGSPPMTWVDQPANTTVAANQGNFATAGGGGVVLTLPAAPSQGDVCKFKDVTGNGLTVLINAGQSIQVGNQTGTQAQDSQLGDALELTWYAAGSTWVGNSIIGNWNVT